MSREQRAKAADRAWDERIWGPPNAPMLEHDGLDLSSINTFIDPESPLFNSEIVRTYIPTIKGNRQWPSTPKSHTRR